MTTHKVKAWPEFYQPLADGLKTCELRYIDRSYKVGDVLHVCEWDDRQGAFTSREIKMEITHMIEGVGPGAIAPLRGLHRGYALLSLKRV